jgi:uncharacterized membrane protein HdeD (DUF308 family)
MASTEPNAAEPATLRYAEIRNSRTWWDVVIGGILVGTGVVVLGDAAVASAFSTVFLGWFLVGAGVVEIAVSLTLVGRGGFWIGMLGGILSVVAGLVFLRHPAATLIILSLAIGVAMFVTGITRLAVAIQQREGRAALVVTGVLSLALGTVVFTQWPTSALWLVGTVLGIQLVVDGASLILVGRPRPVPA